MRKNKAIALLVTVFTVGYVISVAAEAPTAKLEPWPGEVAANAALESGKLSEATTILETAAAEFASHPDVVFFQIRLEVKIKQANKAYDRYLKAQQAAIKIQQETEKSFSAFRQAKKLLARAQAIWIDNPDYDTAETDIDTLIANAPDNPAKKNWSESFNMTIL